jgi:hypothetical protein
VVGVIITGIIVSLIAVFATKLKDRLPDYLIKITDKIKALFVFGLLISSL